MLVIRGRFLHAADVELLRQTTGAPVVNYYPDNPLDGRLREPPFLRRCPPTTSWWCGAPGSPNSLPRRGRPAHCGGALWL